MENLAIQAPRPHPLTAFFVVGTAGAVTVWSAGAQRLYGLSDSQARGRDINSLLGTDLPRADLHSLRQMVSGSTWTCTHHVSRAGRRVPLLSTFSVGESPEGQRELIVSTVIIAPGVEPTPAVRTDPAIPRFGHDLTFFCTDAMMISYVGPLVRNLLGLLPRDLIGRDIRASFNTPDQPKWQAAWDQAMARPGQIFTADLRIELPGDRRQWIRHSLTNMFSDPSVHAMLVNVRNVEDLREANRSRDFSERTLLAVLEASVEGVWLTDTDGGTSFLNARMIELLGLERHQIAGSSLAEILGDSVARLLHTNSITVTAGVRDEHEVRYVSPNGHARWLRVAIAPRFDVEGAPGGTIVMCSEIPDRQSSQSGATMTRLLSSVIQLEGGPRDVPPVGYGRTVTRLPSVTTFGPTPLRLPATAQLFDRDRTRDLIKRMFPALSQRESEIVTRLYLGDRVPAIARALCVSQSTVRNQLASAFRKAGVATQQELITLARNSASA